jgi:hypothetical protein
MAPCKIMYYELKVVLRINDQMVVPLTFSEYVLVRHQLSFRGIDFVYIESRIAPCILLKHLLLDMPSKLLTCVMYIILSETNHRKLSLRSVLPRLHKVSFHPTSPATFFVDLLTKNPNGKKKITTNTGLNPTSSSGIVNISKKTELPKMSAFTEANRKAFE